MLLGVLVVLLLRRRWVGGLGRVRTRGRGDLLRSILRGEVRRLLRGGFVEVVVNKRADRVAIRVGAILSAGRLSGLLSRWGRGSRAYRGSGRARVGRVCAVECGTDRAGGEVETADVVREVRAWSIVRFDRGSLVPVFLVRLDSIERGSRGRGGLGRRSRGWRPTRVVDGLDVAQELVGHLHGHAAKIGYEVNAVGMGSDAAFWRSGMGGQHGVEPTRRRNDETDRCTCARFCARAGEPCRSGSTSSEKRS